MLDMDVTTLMRDVAKQRANSFGDKEAADFIQRHGRRYWGKQQEEAPQSEEGLIIGNLNIGSSIETIEHELLYFLVVHGAKNYEYREGRNIVELNVARTILDELKMDGIRFNNPVYNKIYEIYCRAEEENRLVQPEELTSHSDIEVCDAATDLLFIDDQYAISEIWTKKDVHTTSESEMLGKGIPKAVQLFKTKVVTGRIAELHARLCDENISEDEILIVTEEMSRLNRLKVMLARRMNRLTL